MSDELFVPRSKADTFLGLCGTYERLTREIDLAIRAADSDAFTEASEYRNGVVGELEKLTLWMAVLATVQAVEEGDDGSHTV